jgi:hypothetical protein
MYGIKCLALVGSFTTLMTAGHVGDCTGHAGDVGDN